MSKIWRDYAWAVRAVDANERLVLLYLAERANDAGHCYPAMPTICEAVGLARNTVRRILASLEEQGHVVFDPGIGKGNRTDYQLSKKGQPLPLFEAENADAKRVNCDPLLSDPKGSNADAKRVKPDTPKGSNDDFATNRNRHRTVKEPVASAGANGEFMAASHIWQELGIASGAYDVQILAQVIGFVARDGAMDIQAAAEGLLLAAQAALRRGELVNAFWFKDRKFTQEAGDGTNHEGRHGRRTSPARERVNGNRRALAEALAARGVDGPWNTPRTDRAEVPEPRRERCAERVPD